MNDSVKEMLNMLGRLIGEYIHLAWAPNPAPVHEGREVTVLVAEDEVAILDLIKSILSNFGYKVLAADTPTEALDLARDCNEEIDLLITDVIMPEINEVAHFPLYIVLIPLSPKKLLSQLIYFF